jgi:aerobic carbon-monoxide dehydrogenase medium subunit
MQVPAPFDYARASSVDEAISLLDRLGPEARLVAGGHSLLPMMKLRFARPELLVDVGRLAELRYVRDDGDRIAIGALTSHHAVAGDVTLRAGCGIVAFAAGQIGDPQVRHRGTIGGSVAHGDPASDLPAVLLALDAELVARGPDGERGVAAADFFRSYYETALGPQDVLTEIRVPKLDGAGWSYVKFARRAQDWATVGVAAVVNGAARIALTNMGATPLRATAVEQLLAGGADPAAAAAVAADGTTPPSDVTGSADYRRELVRVLTRRALDEASARR